MSAGFRTTTTAPEYGENCLKSSQIQTMVNRKTNQKRDFQSSEPLAKSDIQHMAFSSIDVTAERIAQLVTALQPTV
jgi:hypothetical protein